MGSFYAELTVGGETYPLRQCHYDFNQATDQRGRAAAKVRHGQLHLTLDVPTTPGLLSWAAAPHKPLGGHVTFFDDAQRTALETLSFDEGHCIHYHEHFHAGDASHGAYICQLTIVAPKLTLSPGGAPGTFAAPAPRDVVAAPSAIVPPGATAIVAATPAAVPPEYTLDEFKKTIWHLDKVAPDVGERLYQHFNAAKASIAAGADPTPHWQAMQTLVSSSTFIDQEGKTQILNDNWPPAGGGFNKHIVQPAPPDKFDRYQQTVEINPDGTPRLEGKFTSPVPPTGAFDYEARALKGNETDYDLMYEIEVLKELPFKGLQADIIPWYGHAGNGVQTQMLFPPKDPAIDDYPWSWKKLSKDGYVKITYKSSPSGKFLISPDGKTAIANPDYKPANT